MAMTTTTAAATFCLLGHPAAGHINPTLPVVAELVRRGHRVVYFATEPFRARIEASGAEFRSYGAQELFERNLAQGGLCGGMAGLMETTKALLPGLRDTVAALAPHALLVEAHAVWGNLLAQILDCPTITLASMFAINEQLLTPAEFVGYLYGAGPPAAARAGLLALGQYFDLARDLDHHLGTRSPGIIDFIANRQRLNIVFSSRAFQIGGTGPAFGADYQFVGTPEALAPAAPRASAASSLPCIFVSMGTMYNDEPGLYRACFAAFADRPFRVVIAIGHRMDPAQLPPPPANVEVHTYVPQVQVLQETSLFITHGGLNSAHEAMIAGVPMLVLPRTADHHVVAKRVAEVGAGIVLERAEATAARIADLADQVLADAGFRTRSAAIGQTLRSAGGAVRAVDEILAFASCAKTRTE
jgi:MGT family glycosyltransferase